MWDGVDNDGGVRPSLSTREAQSTACPQAADDLSFGANPISLHVKAIDSGVRALFAERNALAEELRKLRKSISSNPAAEREVSERRGSESQGTARYTLIELGSDGEQSVLPVRGDDKSPLRSREYDDPMPVERPKSDNLCAEGSRDHTEHSHMQLRQWEDGEKGTLDNIVTVLGRRSSAECDVPAEDGHRTSSTTPGASSRGSHMNCKAPNLSTARRLAGADRFMLSMQVSKFTMRHGFSLSHNPSVSRCLFSYIAQDSRTARWAFFLGGFAILRERWWQVLYDAVFLGSFALCFFTCLANMSIRTPPYYDFAMEMVTAWFHVFGLHSWLFWRAFSRDGGLLDLVRGISSSSRGGPSGRWRATLRTVFCSLLVLQLLAVALGYLVFPQPAMHFFHSAEGPLWKRGFAVVHAVIMWLGIPQHVPTVIASIGVYYFVCSLHVLDAWQATDCMEEAADLEDRQFQLQDCCERLEAVQDRLTHTSRNLAMLWVHQVVYAGAQLIIVAMHLNHISSAHPDVADWDLQVVFKVAYDVWTAGIGVALFMTAMVFPSGVSGVFVALPRNFCKSLRKRGFTIRDLTGVIDYFFMEAVGYRIGTCQVNQAMASNFTAAITMAISLLLMGQGLREG